MGEALPLPVHAHGSHAIAGADGDFIAHVSSRRGVAGTAAIVHALNHADRLALHLDAVLRHIAVQFESEHDALPEIADAQQALLDYVTMRPPGSALPEPCIAAPTPAASLQQLHAQAERGYSAGLHAVPPAQLTTIAESMAADDSHFMAHRARFTTEAE
ncbi:MAG: hypothetical protein KBC46_03300 [Ferrovibrio sp.]|nr:hypothetical protein [Ferrovibrio sp.]